MGVGVDEPRAHDLAGGVDRLGRLLGDPHVGSRPDRGDATVPDADIGSEPFGAGAVDNRAALDDHVEHPIIVPVT